ncbi:probable phospholipid-transporting ATPase IA isoform X1 [Daphnia magna]|uniref:probable phospholipid-transporting ATPase IA isoform X1 n=1 Tax=Daphnia magna TaxID=35525 RepID=UPI0006DD5DB1|nr:probable phospholipid-transporting ATPase IA isoform X1 [Daphnia magna]
MGTFGIISRLSEEEDDQTSGATEAAECVELRAIRIQVTGQRFCSNRVSTAKYNFVSFLPCFLFEQFRRYSNCFFLFIALLQQIPDVSPTGRYTTLVPLLFILAVSATKEIVEDFKRHKADQETNKRQVEVLRGGQWLWLAWQQINVGDVVRVRAGAFFPADLILISSSEPHSLCYIETANLDGETNLKIRQALPTTAKLLSVSALGHLQGTLHCELPNRHLYEFTGTLRLTNHEPLALGPDQLLQRGARLQNTKWATGIVLYTGHETKLLQNSSAAAPLKRSTVDQAANMQILLLFFLLVMLALLASSFNEFWASYFGFSHWYLGLEDLPTANFGYNLLTYIILFNNLIPISLQVTIEVVRFFQATFINNDSEMYHVATNTPACARTSNLNEELGQVKYVFTDKTGTLTQNIMEFQQCSVGGTIYAAKNDVVVNSSGMASSMIQDLSAKHSNAPYIREFLTLLAVCHTVIPEKDETNPDILHYHAASPDERALIQGAARLGWVLSSRTPETITITAEGMEHRYQLLHILEFSSDRKRMSVIVRTPSGKIKLFCKGADTVIYERLGSVVPTGPQQHQQYIRQVTTSHLEAFAREGLRTLCCAVAEIPHDIYEEWKHTYHRASISMQNREEKLADAANLIENNLVLLGATAIEDKLQEEVPETIEALLEADIRVWMLTGDKQETAINIGHACRLLNSNMELLVMNEDSLDGTREVIGRWLSTRSEGSSPLSITMASSAALVVDGQTLKYAMSCDLKKDFLQLCLQCRAVICCRVTPSQKAEIVEAVTVERQAVTLAIGDGANDVAMIQKAHVGVGISGMEGLQAACASDYSIAQFRFLRRLLLVHGASNYYRMCRLILYSFYKNITLYVIELWFAHYSAWSGQILFERWTIGLYNVLFTAAPPLALGLFDRRCTAEVSYRYPQLYKPSQTAQHFNVKVFWYWMLKALLHSMLLFWLPLMAFGEDIVWSNGKDGGYLILGNAVYTYVVVTVCLKAALETSSWTWLSLLAIGGSVLTWFLFLAFYSHFWPSLPLAANMAGMSHMLLSSPVFWWGLIMAPATALLPDFSIKTFWNTMFKSFTDQVCEREINLQRSESGKLLDSQRRDSRTKLVETARLMRSVRNVFRRPHTSSDGARGQTELELSHGYAFSQEEHGAVRQGDMVRAYDTTLPSRSMDKL